MENNDRTALIERLRDATEGPRMLMNEAATMLEADAVPQEPVAYLAWRDGKPCWEGDDCVCADAVYPVDHDDDRTSMPVYLAPQQQTATSDEWLANCPQSVRDLANKIKAEMAVPQEPVAILNHAHGLHAIRSVKLDGLPDGEYKLYAAPQRPRLTDEEILTLWAQTYVERGTSGIEFARSIERKVRGEA